MSSNTAEAVEPSTPVGFVDVVVDAFTDQQHRLAAAAHAGHELGELADVPMALRALNAPIHLVVVVAGLELVARD